MAGTPAELTPEARNWNVLLITVDTLRADRVGVYQQASGSNTPQVQTPTLDGLAKSGVRFDNASTTVPFTLPAHTSLMTGTYPPTHGVRENVGFSVPGSLPTLAQKLQQDRMATSGFVSAFVLDSKWGIARGFDSYHDDFSLDQLQNTADLGSVQRPGPETLASATQWLDSRPEADQNRPFFMWVHLYDPHDPYTPEEPFRSQYPGRPYDAEVAYTDALLGGFLDQLRERGLYERTLVIVTADHGEGLGDHGEAFHGYFIYDTTMRVPLIARFPGELFAGQVVEEAVSHVDLMPTLLELRGLEIPELVQGTSLLPLMQGSAAQTPGTERTVYAESYYALAHYGWAPLRSLRGERWKLIEAPRPELFDIPNDPLEGNDLASEQSTELARFRSQLAELEQQLEQEGSQRDATADVDEQALAQLQALGYVVGRADLETDTDLGERADPKDKIALHQRIMIAQSRIGSEDPGEAKRLLELALEEDPALIDAHQMLGSIALKEEQNEEAIRRFQGALAQDPEHKPSLHGLATAYRRTGRAEEALVGFRRLLELSGQDSKATIAIADLEVEQGNLEAARSALEQANEDNAPALVANKLGEVLVLLGDTQAGRRHFEEALERNDELIQPWFNLAVLYEDARDAARAAQHYKRTIELAPTHYKAQFNLGRLHLSQGKTAEGLAQLRAALESNPEFAVGHFFLGKALMDQGQDLEAAEHWTRKGLALDADEALGWMVLADVLNRQGRTEEANQAVARGRSIAAQKSNGS